MDAPLLGWLAWPSLSAPGMMAAGTRGRVLNRRSIRALWLLGLLLSRSGVIRGTRTIERSTRHGIKWRTRAFHTGNIFSAAISKHRANVRAQNDGHEQDGNQTFLHSGIPYKLFAPACVSPTLVNVLRAQGWTALEQFFGDNLFRCTSGEYRLIGW
jgi:hypothetical protein